MCDFFPHSETMITDPYQHLESLDESTLAFVAEANSQTQQTFMQSPYFYDTSQAVLNTLQAHVT